uniref:Uncharacterized protein n=1 Tax=Anguilla anguilla TaxID=7936 RepID=A0A0E9PX74_ANGAN
MLCQSSMYIYLLVLSIFSLCGTKSGPVR